MAKLVSASELRDGDMFEEGEALRMRNSDVYRIRRECVFAARPPRILPLGARAWCGPSAPSRRHAWCGRLRPNTKLRLTWRFCFGPNGREHSRAAAPSLRRGLSSLLEAVYLSPPLGAS